MAINNILYDRNHEGYNKSIGAKKLYITGTLPQGVTGVSYEGRLQIHNAIGACSVEIISGTLPTGGGVYVDNTTKEIVVAWPGYSETVIPLENPGFETGDLTGWQYSTVGGSGNLAVTSSQKDTGIYSAYWAGGKGLGSEGGIECIAVNNTRAEVTPGQRVTAKLRVMYNPGGGTPKGSRGQCRLNWYNSSDQLIGTSYGYLIKTRKFNGKWTDTIASEKAIPDSKYVRLAGWVTATGAGHTYFDNATWDVPTSTGTNIAQTIHLHLRVTDSAGRVADWTGDIIIRQSFVIANLDFNSGLTDKTGRIWTMNSSSLTDILGHDPIISPYISSTHALEGSALESVPDIDMPPYAIKYRPTSGRNILSVFGSDAPGMDKDFCIEFFARLNIHRELDTVAHCFLSVGSVSGSGARPLFIRGAGSVANLEKQFISTYPAEYLAVMSMPYGVYCHFAITREGDRANVWFNGELFFRQRVSQNLDFYNIIPTDAVSFGGAFSGGGGSAFDWQGQIDCIRITNNWARYTQPFTPPTVPY